MRSLKNWRLHLEFRKIAHGNLGLQTCESFHGCFCLPITANHVLREILKEKNISCRTVATQKITKKYQYKEGQGKCSAQKLEVLQARYRESANYKITRRFD